MIYKLNKLTNKGVSYLSHGSSNIIGIHAKQAIQKHFILKSKQFTFYYAIYTIYDDLHKYIM